MVIYTTKFTILTIEACSLILFEYIHIAVRPVPRGSLGRRRTWRSGRDWTGWGLGEDAESDFRLDNLRLSVGFVTAVT